MLEVALYVYFCLSAQVFKAIFPAAELKHTGIHAEGEGHRVALLPFLQLRAVGALSPSSSLVSGCITQPDCAGKPRAAHRPAGPSCSELFIWHLMLKKNVPWAVSNMQQKIWRCAIEASEENRPLRILAQVQRYKSAILMHCLDLFPISNA